jgi:uncharacterized protein YbgA (DUF1722 family)/uncharacterized protein YbbK (DUF523 family)
MNSKIPIGISSCLLGEAVRFDGGHKRDAYIVGTLSQYFEFRAFCPEMAIGLGVPRASIRLAKTEKGIRCIGVKNPELDVTEALINYANQLATQIHLLCGFIVKKDSPSCGLYKVKVYDSLSATPRREGQGIFAAQLQKLYPYLPIEEEGRLGDSRLRENFIQRIYVFYRWQQLINSGLTIAKLMQFHAQHKLMIMSHGDYQPLGRLLATLNQDNLIQIATDYIVQLMSLLSKIATRGQHLNVLQHIQGYLKKQLSTDEKKELSDMFNAYHIGEIPLIVPLTLLKHHFRHYPDPYIQHSYYFQPYPQSLGLTNQL